MAKNARKFSHQREVAGLAEALAALTARISRIEEIVGGHADPGEARRASWEAALDRAIEEQQAERRRDYLEGLAEEEAASAAA